MGGGLGANSRDKQEIYMRRGQLAGLWWVGARRELLVLVTAKTRKQKPENPWLSGIFYCYVQ